MKTYGTKPEQSWPQLTKSMEQKPSWKANSFVCSESCGNRSTTLVKYTTSSYTGNISTRHRAFIIPDQKLQYQMFENMQLHTVNSTSMDFNKECVNITLHIIHMLNS